MSQSTVESNRNKYFNTYFGKSLLKDHNLNEHGFWQIYGEDPNCDFGGHHHEPIIGIFQGKLDDIVSYAVVQEGFWQWGGGGRIKKVNIRKIDKDSVNRRQEKIARLNEIEKEAEALRESLKDS